MIIYNITSKVDNGIVHEWLQWINEHHIPEVMSTGLFYEHRFFKLLEQDESEGRTYIVQFYAVNRKNCEIYVQQHSQRIMNYAMEKWGSKFVSFYSLLEAVQ